MACLRVLSRRGGESVTNLNPEEIGLACGNGNRPLPKVALRFVKFYGVRWILVESQFLSRSRLPSLSHRLLPTA